MIDGGDVTGGYGLWQAVIANSCTLASFVSVAPYYVTRRDVPFQSVFARGVHKMFTPNASLVARSR
jgi:hypothetical protein